MNIPILQKGLGVLISSVPFRSWPGLKFASVNRRIIRSNVPSCLFWRSLVSRLKFLNPLSMTTHSTEVDVQLRLSLTILFDGIASFLGSGSLPAWRATCVFSASETDWHRRHAKRREAVRFIKSTTEYAELQAWWFQSTAVAMPPTPNPNDRLLAKRSWEARVMQWRSHLKARHAHFRWQ